MLLSVPHQMLRFGLSAAGKAKFAALPEKNPAHLFAVQVSYCAGSVLLTKMLHFKRAKSAFAALCNVEKRQAVWYNREHADNTRLDFCRASPQSKRMDFNIMNKNSFRYKNKRRIGKLRSFLSPALAALMVFSSLAACTLTACKKDDSPNVIVDILPVTKAPLPSVEPATAPAAETVSPTATPAPADTNAPLNTNAPIDQTVFDNCAFVGNSTFEGLYKYGVITHGKFFTRVGLNILSVYTQTTTTGSVPVIDELNTGSYEAVILMFGENELGWPNLNTFIEKYSKFLDDIWQRQPGCEIFIMLIPPVSAKVSSTSTTGVTNENIQLYNAQLVDLAARRGCHYVSVPEALVDANGCLPADASGDGIHLNMTYSKYWADHICRTVAAVLRP